MTQARETKGPCHSEPYRSAPPFMPTGSNSATQVAPTQTPLVPAEEEPLRASARLCRLAELDPLIARELGHVWCDLEAAGRLLEGLLGGEVGVVLGFEVIVELVRLYEHLEDLRAAHVDDPLAKNLGNES